VKRNRSRFYGPALALLFVATACDRPASNKATGDSGGTVVIRSKGDLDFADFLVSVDALTQEVLRYLLFLPLVQYDSAMGYQPVLAESYQLQGDTSVLFKLRRDVFWHDGVHTTAHDVAFTFLRGADPETGFPNADWLIGWGIPQVIDSFTIRFPLERMADPLASVAMFPVMPRHLLQSIPAADLSKAEFNKKPVGNGPFRFVEYRANDRWVFDANPNFPKGLGGRPRVGRIVLRVIPDVNATVAELKAGNVDVALQPPTDQYRVLAEDPNLRGIQFPSRLYAFIPWNPKHAPLNDPRVRRALGMAIDRPKLITIARAGLGEPIASPISRFHWAYDSSVRAVFNPDSARALLAQAGLSDRNGDGLLEKRDGSPWEIEFKYAANNTVARDIAELIRSDLEKVGVRLVPRALDQATLTGDLTSNERNFEAALTGFQNDPRLNFRDMFHSAALRGPLHFSSYRSSEIDRLIDRASSEPNMERAKPLWNRFQQVLATDQPWTFLYEYPEIAIVNERVHGVKMDIRGALVTVASWWKSE
jgi:peptide/nickel transport system substrate-binding protein